MGKEVILLVENNQADEELVIRVLKERCTPNSLTVTWDGIDAIERLQPGAPASLPNIVLLELTLQKLSSGHDAGLPGAGPSMRDIQVGTIFFPAKHQDFRQSHRLDCIGYFGKNVCFSRLTGVTQALVRE